MKIAIVGYGKMGKLIEKIAISQGHNISFTIGRSNSHDMKLINPSNTDVAIEFSTPESAYDNLKTLIKNRCSVVCGTTGWLNHYDEIEELVKQHEVGFIYASNFSIGVNIFFELNKTLAHLMAQQSAYEAGIHEIHHTSKKDAPSGTGITLAKQIIDRHPRYTQWSGDKSEKTTSNTLPLLSSRIDPAPGTHEISYKSTIDDIEIKHTAHSREGFVRGAIQAASFVSNREGIFTMKDVLGI